MGQWDFTERVPPVGIGWGGDPPLCTIPDPSVITSGSSLHATLVADLAAGAHASFPGVAPWFRGLGCKWPSSFPPKLIETGSEIHGA